MTCIFHHWEGCNPPHDGPCIELNMKIVNGWKDVSESPKVDGVYETYWYGESGGHDVHEFKDGKWIETPYQKPISHWLDSSSEVVRNNPIIGRRSPIDWENK